jgi:hypothetical protein
MVKLKALWRERVLKNNVAMWTKLTAIVCSLLACPLAVAYQLDETINVIGNGDLSVNTKIPDAYDFAQGIGPQQYERHIISTDVQSHLGSIYTLEKMTSANASIDASSPIQRLDLVSKYKNGVNLSKNYMGDYNHYSIGMDDKGDIFALRGNFVHGLGHTVAASWIDNLKSESTVDIGENNLATSYDISGTGILSETIVDHSDRVVKHMSLVASSSVNGNFKLNSNLQDQISPEFTAFTRFGSK